MKETNCHKHRLEGLKDFTEKKSVASEQSDKIRDSDNKQGWEIKRLDDACEVEYGTRVVQKRDGGTVYPVYGGGGATFFMDTFNRENCLVVARFAMSAQCTRFVEGKFFLNDSGLTIRPKNKKELLPEFLNLQMFFLNDHIYSLSRGTAQRNLDVPAFRNIQISYPKSLPEQQRIVSILDECFAAIDKAKANAEQNLKNAKELFESYLQGVFEKKGDGWEEKNFEDLIHENQIGLIKCTKEQGNDKPYRYLKMDSITSGNSLIHDKYVYVDADKSELEKFSLTEGDFLFNTRNSYELVGKTCVFTPVDNEPTLFNNNIMRVVFKKGISSKFINYAFSSELVKERLKKLKSGTTSVVGIYYKGLRNLKIPITKYDDQQTIVRQLDALRAETQKLEAVYEKKIADLEELKKSILQKAFAGELKTQKLQTV